MAPADLFCQSDLFDLELKLFSNQAMELMAHHQLLAFSSFQSFPRAMVLDLYRPFLFAQVKKLLF
jgi:hypothetical protein